MPKQWWTHLRRGILKPNMFRKRYTFSNLCHQPLVENMEPVSIFETSEQFVKSDFVAFQNPLDLLETKLSADEFYYVLHEYIITKGKMIFFRGCVVIAKKTDIITFVTAELLHNNLRPIRILAQENPSFCLRFTENEALLFEKSN
jgi:hypothetical protein